MLRALLRTGLIAALVVAAVSAPADAGAAPAARLLAHSAFGVASDSDRYVVWRTVGSGRALRVLDTFTGRIGRATLPAGCGSTQHPLGTATVLLPCGDEGDVRLDLRSGAARRLPRQLPGVGAVGWNGVGTHWSRGYITRCPSTGTPCSALLATDGARTRLAPLEAPVDLDQADPLTPPDACPDLAGVQDPRLRGRDGRWRQAVARRSRFQVLGCSGRARPLGLRRSSTALPVQVGRWLAFGTFESPTLTLVDLRTSRTRAFRRRAPEPAAFADTNQTEPFLTRRTLVVGSVLEESYPGFRAERWRLDAVPLDGGS